MATLYLMYISWMRTVANSQKAASKSTFYSVSHVWRGVLRFRKKSDHALCVECARLKSLIRDASVRASASQPIHTAICFLSSVFCQDFEQHAKLCDALLHHYSVQYRNRMVYWAARQRAQVEKDMVRIICDSYDKSKLQLPRWDWRRCPKRAIYEISTSDWAAH